MREREQESPDSKNFSFDFFFRGHYQPLHPNHTKKSVHLILSSSSAKKHLYLISLLNPIRSPLGKRVQRTRQMTRHLERQHRSIHDSHIGRSIYHMVTVDHTSHLLGHHGRCGNVVEVGAVRRLEPLTPDFVACVGGDEVETGGGFAGNHVAEGGGGGDGAGGAGGGDLLFEIPVELEVVGLDGGCGGWVGGVDVDVSAREGEETPVLERGGAGGGRVDDDFANDVEVFENHLVLDVEERLQRGLVDHAAGVVDDGLGVGGERGFDFGADLVQVVSVCVAGVEVANVASGASEVLGGGVGGIRRGLVLEVLANGRKVNLDIDVVLVQDAMLRQRQMLHVLLSGTDDTHVGLPIPEYSRITEDRKLPAEMTTSFLAQRV